MHLHSAADPASLSPQLIDTTGELLAAAGRRNHRCALVFTGTRDGCRAAAEQVLAATGLLAVHWFSDRAPRGAEASQGAAAMRLLGTELDALVFDAWSGFDPNAFGALSGTVRGGGLLLILAPVLRDWPGYADPQNERITVFPYAAEKLSGRFVARLVRVIESDRQVLCIENGVIRSSPDPLPDVSVSAEAIESPCRTADQQRAVEAVIRVATGHRRRPVVLTSDRGRGKSAALGIAAAQLIRQGRGNILLTGPGRESVDAVLRHAGGIRFVPPDELVRSPQTADLLLVDEAAAIPVPLLESLLKRYARIAFATTVHGYEGTGRGFALRFSRVLDAHTNRWKTLFLETPVRWAPGDPVERLVFRMLALDAEAAPGEALQDAGVDTAVIERLRRDALAVDERVLSELFGLLVQAHYRTRPLDLRHLLDGPNLSVYVVRMAGHITATALVAEEGGFDASTAEAISAGRTRPHGHLLPEALAAYQGLVQAPQLRCARIMRIAVHPAVQRQGLGTRLVEAVTEQARCEGLDYIGSSFAATPELLDFWTKSGWSVARLGIQRGASSGSHSVLMLRGLSEQGRALTRQAGERFLAQFPQQLCDSLRDLDAALVTRLLRRQAGPYPVEPDTADWQDAKAFAFEQRLLEVSIGSVWRVVCHALMTGQGITELDEDQLRLLVARVLQKHDWPTCAQRVQLPGRPQALSLLRAAVAKLIR
ncbi:MAG TPA: tRNA(Met) cytidine acetyltransferase [Gammaproteobacteria bacterium]|nr:tRNA(Met) cytidine acetyltransferase [Gammaproteobacteria bacterium]